LSHLTGYATQWLSGHAARKNEQVLVPEFIRVAEVWTLKIIAVSRDGIGQPDRDVECHERLGGLLCYFQRTAA